MSGVQRIKQRKCAEFQFSSQESTKEESIYLYLLLFSILTHIYEDIENREITKETNRQD